MLIEFLCNPRLKTTLFIMDCLGAAVVVLVYWGKKGEIPSHKQGPFLLAVKHPITICECLAFKKCINNECGKKYAENKCKPNN